MKTETPDAPYTMPASVAADVSAQVEKFLTDARRFEEAREGRFAITDERSADWYVGKLADLDAGITRVKAQAAQRVKELETDRARLTSLFGGQLEAWARGEAERRRRKSVTLQNGTVAFRAVAPAFRIADPSDALTTARAVCPQAVTTRTVEDFDAATFLAHAERTFAETGEVLPGAERTDARETVAVRFPGTAKAGGPEAHDTTD